MALYHALRPLLFRLDAEAAHGAGMLAAGVGEALSPAVRAALARGSRNEALGQTLFAHDGADGRPARPGLYVPNPIGLAAGFDKNAERVPLWAAVGFGFAEVGSVTAQARDGNPKPRAFRLPDDRALVNRMGLNNAGAAAVGQRLATLRADGLPDPFVLGVNVAKTHDPAILGAAALDDFAETVRHVAPHADYLALNVSCPNTEEGKTFEEPEALDELLARVRVELVALGGHAATVPVLVKLSPPAPRHFDAGRLAESVAVCRRHGVDGFIATNTAPDRAGLRTDGGTLDAIGKGGLSGRPLQARSTALVRHLYRLTGGALPVVGVGGVDSSKAAYAKIRAGASLVGLYTGLVYEGPGLVGRIARGLARRLDRDGFGSVEEAVGVDA